MLIESKMEDYLFRTPEGAQKKSEEIGFNGEIHESTLADGTKLYSPAKTEDEFIKWYRKNDPDAEEELGATAAEYQGRKVTLNKPFRTPKEKKKFAVYVKNPAGKVIIVRFGDPNMEIKRDDPKRRKAFRDRHNCAEKKDKTTAGYWSCYQWRSGSKVESIEEFNKTDNMMETVMGGCGCGGKCGSVEAAEPTPNDDETHNEYMSRCQEMGYSEEECMAAHEGHKFIEEEQLEGYGGGGGGGGGYSNSCRTGYKMQGGKCVKATFQLDIDISVDEVMVDATTGNQVIRISGIAFHQGVNKNGWEITRKGANLAVSQMVGADLTLNHPKSDNGRFRRNMDGGVDEAVVGVVSEASIVDDGFEWSVKFKANVHRKELFEALESGLWLREGYGVSIGGTGIPDEIIEADDGSAVMKFESDFQFDHLAIVHKPAYSGAKIESVERVNIAETKEGFNSHSHSVQNIAKDMTTMSEEEIIIASEEEVVVETPVAEETPSIDYAAEIEALKASLAEREEELNAIKADEEAKVEEVRLSLVKKASELGIEGIDSLPSETLESIIASFESKMPVASEEVVEELSPVESNMGMVASEKADLSSEPVVANYLNRKLIKTPESLYEKAWNAWANGWNNTLSASETQAPTFREARDKKLI